MPGATHERADHKATSEKGQKEKNNSMIATGTGALAAGAAELLMFHPVESVTRRIQNDPKRLMFWNRPLESFHAVKQVALRDKLYAGLSVGAVDKIVKRGYKFGGKTILVDHVLEPYCSDFFKQIAGKHYSPLMHACAGSALGAGETLFLPFDWKRLNLQINSKVFTIETAPNVFRKLANWEIAKKYRFKMWSGISATLGRNIPGSFLLFGGEEAVYRYVFQRDRRSCSVSENFAAASVGATASVVLTLPLDVIKTRLQVGSTRSTHTTPEDKLPTSFKLTTEKEVCVDKAADKSRSVLRVAKDIYKNEGVRGFFKANTLKSGTAIGKLAFGLVATPRIAQTIQNLFDSIPATVSGSEPSRESYAFRRRRSNFTD